MDGESRYLRLEDLRRLRHLTFTSRRRVEGAYAGRHVSPHRGHSVEFADYRAYMPGDEVGDIDWKVYGRSDRLYVKLFEHHSDMTVNLLLDGSGSMAYAGIDPPRDATKRYSKFDHAARLSAAIALLAIKQQDRASLSVAREGLKQWRRPSGSMARMEGWFKELQALEPSGEARLDEVLHQLSQKAAKRGLLILLSDLLDEPEAILKGLSLFTHRGSEVIVFHVLHTDELKLPELDDAVFQDSETASRLTLNVGDVRSAYDRSMKRFLGMWSSACRARGMDYRLVRTSEDPIGVLSQYLGGRA